LRNAHFRDSLHQEENKAIITGIAQYSPDPRIKSIFQTVDGRLIDMGFFLFFGG
jgi:hypothetical protein